MTNSLEESLIKAGVQEDKAKETAELITSYEDAIDVLRVYGTLKMQRHEVRVLQYMIAFNIVTTLASIAIVCTMVKYLF